MTEDELAFDREIAAQIDWSVPIDEHELEQLRHFGALSLWEKLGWLEEAQRYVEQMKANRAARGLGFIDL